MSNIIDLTNDSDGESCDNLDVHYSFLGSSSASEVIGVGGYREGYERGSVMDMRHEDVDSMEDSETSEESNLDDDTGLLSSDNTSDDFLSYSGCRSPWCKVKKQKW